MGCRPSRRRSSCVRVAGDEPWEVRRPSRNSGDSGVKLRRRSSTKRSVDEGRSIEGGSNHPMDRYSAPLADRHFPLHSCTTATYEYGCCGTSQITLRLSKNGSTLEIEKCHFQPSVTSCHHCTQQKTSDKEQFLLESPLRAMSAPNLSITPQNIWSGPRVQLSQHRNEQQLHVSEIHQCNFPSHEKGGGAIVIERESSPKLSVHTASEVDVDLKSCCTSAYQSPRINLSLHRSVTEHDQAETLSSSCKENYVHDTGSNTKVTSVQSELQSEFNPHKHTSQNSGDSSQGKKSQDDDGQKPGSAHSFSNQIVDDSNKHKPQFSACKSGSIVSLPDELVVEHSVEQTAFYVTATNTSFNTAINTNQSGSRGLYLVKTGPDETKETSSVQTEQDGLPVSSCVMSDQSERIVSNIATHSNHNANINTSPSHKMYCHEGNISRFGATDYRIRLLGAGDDEITSCIMSSKIVSGSSTMSTKISQLHDQISDVNGCQSVLGFTDKKEIVANSSRTTLISNNEDNPSKVTTCAEAGPEVAQQSDESTDTGCESDEEEYGGLQTSDLELIPVYVHTNFRSGETD